MASQRAYCDSLDIPFLIQTLIDEERVYITSFEEIVPEGDIRPLYSKKDDPSKKTAEFKTEEPPPSLFITANPTASSVAAFSASSNRKMDSGKSSAASVRRGAVSLKKVTGEPIKKFEPSFPKIPFDFVTNYHNHPGVEGETLDPKFKSKIFLPITTATWTFNRGKDAFEVPGVQPASWYGRSINFSMDQEGYLRGPFDLLQEAQVLGLPPRVLLGQEGLYSILRVVVPFNARSARDAHLSLACGKSLGFASNEKSWQQIKEYPKLLEASRKLLPHVRLARDIKVNGGGSAQIELEVIEGSTSSPVTGFNGEFYLQAVSGYLPKTIVRAKNGKAPVDVHALGLRSGEEIRILVGIDSQSFASSVVINVS